MHISGERVMPPLAVVAAVKQILGACADDEPVQVLYFDGGWFRAQEQLAALVTTGSLKFSVGESGSVRREFRNVRSALESSDSQASAGDVAPGEAKV